MPQTDSEHLESWPVKKLRPAPLNPRRHGENDIAELAASIRRFGFRAPILATADGEIVAGEGRWRAAQILGLVRVPVVLVEGLDADERAAYLLADNLVAELSTWDTDLLLQVLDQDQVEIDGTGFTDGELEDLHEDDEADPTPPTPASAVSRVGDVWTLGDHLITCGDALDEATWGPPADLIFTDPPYGIALNAETPRELQDRGRRIDRRVIAGDDLPRDAFAAFIERTCEILFGGLRPGGTAYVFHAEGMGLDVVFRQAFLGAGFVSAQALVWVKDAFTLGRQDYQWRHETILYGRRPGGRRYFKGGAEQDSVWHFPRPRRSDDHPTMKPVALVAQAIKNSARPKDLVVDPFLGSGTTLIACQELGRRCHGIELDPSYVDVAVHRWQAQTGKLARDAAGHTLEERHNGEG